MNKMRMTAVLTLAALLFSVIPVQVLAAEKVEIPVGTMILLTLPATLTATQAPVGTTVAMTVSQDVVVNGKVVVKAGAPATGTVVSAKESGYLGSSGELGVSLISVQAVDGTQLPITGNRMIAPADSTAASVGLSLFICPLFALQKGKEAVIPSGTVFEARTNGLVSVAI